MGCWEKRSKNHQKPRACVDRALLRDLHHHGWRAEDGVSEHHQCSPTTRRYTQSAFPEHRSWIASSDAMRDFAWIWRFPSPCFEGLEVLRFLRFKRFRGLRGQAQNLAQNNVLRTPRVLSRPTGMLRSTVVYAFGRSYLEPLNILTLPFGTPIWNFHLETWCWSLLGTLCLKASFATFLWNLPEASVVPESW